MSDDNLDSLIAPYDIIFAAIISTLRGAIEWPECIAKTGCSFDDISDLQLKFVEVKKSTRLAIPYCSKDPKRFSKVYHAITDYALFHSSIRQMSEVLRECKSTALPLAESIKLASELRHMIDKLSNRLTYNIPPSLMIM